MHPRTIALALVGSRGDVQPGLAVAAELRSRGHTVTLGVAPNMLNLTRGFGLDAVPIGVDSKDLLTSDLVRRDMRAANPVRRVRALKAVAAHGWDELRTGLVNLSAGADLVVTGLLGQEIGSAVAEARDISFAALHYSPVRANTAVPLVPVATGRLQGAAWRAGEAVRWGLTRAEENRHRAGLGLPRAVVDLPRRLRDRGALEVQAYDPALVPGLSAEWGTRRPFAGWLDLVRADHDPLLDAWLEEGPAPVYVGFGSMPVKNPAALLANVSRMCRDLDVRALVTAGWSEVAASQDERVRIAGAVNHTAVLPRCSVAVHHGGSGTTAAAVRAGIPSVVCPFSGDQRMWGGLLRRHGVGTWTRFSRLDAVSLRDSVSAMLEPAVRQRARGLADRMIPAKDAVATAADLLLAAV